METAAIDESFTLDASKGPDGCHSRHCIPELEWFHELDLLGSGMSMFLYPEE